MPFRRAAIFVFFDADGIAGDYIDYYLRELSKHVHRLIIVSNGDIKPETRALFLNFTKEVYVRENKGFDAWAYKFGLEKIGWTHLSDYDEVILANDTVFGPVFPLHEVFDAMTARNADFWGVTSHNGIPGGDFTGCNPYGFIPPHIQSYFVVFGSKVLKSLSFSTYWNELDPIRNWNEAVGKFETCMTHYFECAGFAWGAYVDVPEEIAGYHNVLTAMPKLLLDSYRMPFVKRKLFVKRTSESLTGEQPAEVFRFLENHTQYDVSLIWKDLLRRHQQYDIFNGLSLVYSLPSDRCANSSDDAPGIEKKKVALAICVKHKLMIDEAMKFIDIAPKYADIFIYVDGENADVAKAVEQSAGEKTETRKTKDSEIAIHDQSIPYFALLDIADRYEIVCIWAEEREFCLNNNCAQNSRADKNSSNLLYSEAYANNIVQLFDRHPMLGMLSPIPPNHEIYFDYAYNEWRDKCEEVAQLNRLYGIDLPVSADKPPICPYTNSFWFRSAALKDMIRAKRSNIALFDKMATDRSGTESALKFVYPFAVQQAGYYPALAMTDQYAALEYTSFSYYLSQLHKLNRRYGIRGGDVHSVFSRMAPLYKNKKT
jgi:rhamnosyltransferase